MTGNEKLDAANEVMGEGKPKYMRPSECRTLMRRTLSKEFKGILDGFVAVAKEGSCPHLKLAVELLKPDRKATSRKKGTATKYWEMLEREAREKEQLKKEQLAAGQDLQVEDRS